MLVYFSGSARDIKRDIGTYRAITKAIYESGGVISNSWTEAAVHLQRFPSEELWWKEICANAQNGIHDSDVIIVEATGRSTFGVGYEVALALDSDKKILALVREGENSSYIRGLDYPQLRVAKYRPDNVSSIVSDFLSGIK